MIKFLKLFILTIPLATCLVASTPYIKLDDVTFHVQTFGEKKNPTVVVVHGGPGWDFKSLLPLRDLSDEFFVVFYDQRGTGLSPRVSASELTLESYIKDLDNIIEHYSNGKKVNLIGHSWGAMLVSSYIGKYPQKVDLVVLGEPGFLTTDMMKEADITFGPKFDIPFLLYATKIWFKSLFIKGDKEASSDYFLGEVAPEANKEYYCNKKVPKVAKERFRASATSMKNVKNLITNAKGEMEIDLVKGVENFTNEILFLASQCNSKIGVEHQKKQMKLFVNARLRVIKDSGHMMFAEKPKESISVVREYLKDATR